MYSVEWDKETGGFLLVNAPETEIRNEIRPVFWEELNLLGFDKYWKYPQTLGPLLWAIGARRYFYRGELVAEAEGGALFSSPKLKVYRSDIEIVPVDVQGMLEKNSAMLQGLVQRALKFIWQSYAKHGRTVDIVAVAFSGGKDSLVTLDLVQRVLEPSQFVVVFGDTGMEVSDTYAAVETAKKLWPYLTFYTAKSQKDVLTNWREMGPPSRIHRWCHVVHKTAPTLLLLRELAGKPAAKALIFDGVRQEESTRRSGYSEITLSGKHKLQINVSPILKWSAAEVFLYIFSRRLFLNRAYRYGCVRVGCAVCPMASRWWDFISGKIYKEDMEPFIKEIKAYALSAGVPSSDLENYLNEGGWKGRGGGRYLAGGGNRVVEQKEGSKIRFILREPSEDWQEWAKTLGEMVWIDKEHGFIQVNGATYPYVIKNLSGGIMVEIDNLGEADRFVHSRFRAVAIKSAYCNYCQACMVECASGALSITEKVRIQNACTHCASCLDISDRACLRAKSLVTSREGENVGEKSILHTYQHFGMRKEWLHEFFVSKQWFGQNTLGNRQFDAMINWLRHAELIERKKNAVEITRLGEKLRLRGANDLLTWAVIWTNLIRNSAPVQWYALKVPWGVTIKKSDVIAKMGESYLHHKEHHKESTRKNAATALWELLRRTPLGNDLGMGQQVADNKKGEQVLYKKGWENPHCLAILYSLYRYAEKKGRYEFTVSELYEEAEEGPYVSFGISKDALSGILQGLSARGESFIRVHIVHDLDNIFLNPSLAAEEVLEID